jgi:acetyl esterase
MSVTQTHNPVVLESASQAFVEATANPPFLYELTPAEARAVLDEVQAAPIDKLPVNDRWVTVPADVGDVRVRIVRPPDAVATLPVILYMHGGGWVIGNAATHDRLVRELAVGTGAAVVFVEYDRSPEARYPVALEQGYATARWIVREGAANQLDPDRIAIAGNSVGGNMTAALTLMAAERGDVRFVHQSMYCPVTDAAMDTGSCEQFAEGYFLTAKLMAWFWDAYAPDVEQRLEPLASPLRASDEQLAGLPPAFVIVDEADVLRDEGEAYAARLRAAGTAVTTVRYDGITHDFMMLNPLSDTHATRAAVAQAIAILRDALHATPRRHRERKTVACLPSCQPHRLLMLSTSPMRTSPCPRPGRSSCGSVRALSIFGTR